MKLEKLTYAQMLNYGPGKRKKLLYRLRRDRREMQKFKYVRSMDGMYQVEGREGCCGNRKLILCPVNFSKLDKSKTYDVAYLVI